MIYRWFGLFILLGIVLLGAEEMRLPARQIEILPSCSFALLQNETRFNCERAKGKDLLVHFWATTCPSCVMELPHLVEQAQKNPQMNIVFVSVNEEPKNVISFLEKKKINWKNGVFAFDLEGQAAKKFGTYKIPESFLYAKTGELRQKFIGAQNWIDIFQELFP